MLYCFLADGFEETEALAPVDILRRAGVAVTTVGVGGTLIRGSHNIYVQADISLDAFTPSAEMQGVILPGGMPGVKNLDAAPAVHKAVRYCCDRGLLICAICAAPSIIGRMGILDGRRATCFPGFEDALTDAVVTGEKVVTDGSVITAKGAGCALEFGFAIVQKVCGSEKAESVAAAMQCR